jgi:guanylate kinase
MVCTQSVSTQLIGTPEKLEERVEKARWELEQLEKNWALFDHFITNDDLSTAEETLRILVGRMEFMRKMVALP